MMVKSVSNRLEQDGKIVSDRVYPNHRSNKLKEIKMWCWFQNSILIIAYVVIPPVNEVQGGI